MRCTENWTCFSCRDVYVWATVTMIYLDVEKHTSFEHNIVSHTHMCVFVWMYGRYVAKVKKILSVCFERYNSAHRCWRILWPAINVKKFLSYYLAVFYVRKCYGEERRFSCPFYVSRKDSCVLGRNREEKSWKKE